MWGRFDEPEWQMPMVSWINHTGCITLPLNYILPFFLHGRKANRRPKIAGYYWEAQWADNKHEMLEYSVIIVLPSLLVLFMYRHTQIIIFCTFNLINTYYSQAIYVAILINWISSLIHCRFISAFFELLAAHLPHVLTFSTHITIVLS